MNVQRRGQLCLCCMCGIPGSGKTTICEHLSLSLSGNYLTFVINFDRLLLDSCTDSAQLWQSLCSEQREEGENFKRARKEILNVVEFLIQQLMADRFDDFTNPGYINDDVWRQFMDLCWKRKCADDIRKASHILIILDDNMYLRSMRYDYYKIAKLYRTGFCQIFVDSSLEKAKKRNKGRYGRDFIDDEVIEKIFHKLETPDCTKNSWEKNNIILNTDSYEKLTEKVISMTDEAFLNPAHPTVQVDANEKLNSQNISSSNLIHQVDLILRKCVSKAMRTGQGKSDLRQLGKQVSSVKEEILHLMKRGEISVPDSLCMTDVKDSSQDENSGMFLYIENIFECKLKLFIFV